MISSYWSLYGKYRYGKAQTSIWLLLLVGSHKGIPVWPWHEYPEHLKAIAACSFVAPAFPHPLSSIFVFLCSGNDRLIPAIHLKDKGAIRLQTTDALRCHCRYSEQLLLADTCFDKPLGTHSRCFSWFTNRPHQVALAQAVQFQNNQNIP